MRVKVHAYMFAIHTITSNVFLEIFTPQTAPLRPLHSKKITNNSLWGNQWDFQKLHLFQILEHCENFVKTSLVLQRFSMFWVGEHPYIHVNDFLKLFVFGNADDCSVFFPRFFPQFTPCFSSSLFVILFSSSQKI